MMRSVTVFLALVSLIGANAQRNLEVGISTGATNFYGDLGNYDGAVQWNSTRPGVQVTFRDFLPNKKRYVTRSLTTEARLSWFRTGYDERAMISGMDVSDLQNFKRGLSFRNDLFGASGHLVLNAYREPYRPLFKQRFFMYFHMGLGVYYGQAKADLFMGDASIENRYYQWADGTLRDAPRGTPESEANIVERDGQFETNLYDWVTETSITGGESGRATQRSPWHIAIPMGMGVRYMVTKQISVGMEFQYYMFTNDRIDDVSERYATYTEIDANYPNDMSGQELSRYISDPSGWGTDGTEGVVTSRRGNPGLMDTISFLSVEVSYKFKRKPNRRSYVSI